MYLIKKNTSDSFELPERIDKLLLNLVCMYEYLNLSQMVGRMMLMKKKEKRKPKRTAPALLFNLFTKVGGGEREKRKECTRGPCSISHFWSWDY